jgi:hypothetical protein
MTPRSMQVLWRAVLKLQRELGFGAGETDPVAKTENRARWKLDRTLRRARTIVRMPVDDLIIGNAAAPANWKWSQVPQVRRGDVAFVSRIHLQEALLDPATLKIRDIIERRRLIDCRSLLRRLQQVSDGWPQYPVACLMTPSGRPIRSS